MMRIDDKPQVPNDKPQIPNKFQSPISKWPKQQISPPQAGGERVEEFQIHLFVIWPACAELRLAGRKQVPVIWWLFVVHLSFFSYGPDVSPANIFSNNSDIEKIPFVDRK
jgi:hypothetical protein